MKKLVVISYTDGKVNVYPYDENIWESPEDYTVNDSHVIDSNCCWIVVDDLEIKVH